MLYFYFSSCSSFSFCPHLQRELLDLLLWLHSLLSTSKIITVALDVIP
jgi:hypothetical protein